MSGEWLAKFGDYIGGWPESYLLIDVETNGYATDPETYPTELGFTLVEDRAATSADAIVLDWSGLVDAADFWGRVERTEYQMAQKGLTYATPVARIRAEGLDPRDVFPAYRRMIADALAAGVPIVGHNFYSFDGPLLVRVARRFFGGLELPADQVLDTGLMQVALGLEWGVPARHVPREEFYRLTRRFQGRTRWSLYPFCVEKYGLDADMSKGHAADYDTHVNHLLFEAFRTLAEAWRRGQGGGRPAPTPPPTP